MRNPHFDDGVVIWKDEYSGRYEPVPYDIQFDDQWRLFLEGREGFHDHTGVETADEYIDDRIYELTGERDYLLRRRWGLLAGMIGHITGRTARAERRGVGGRLYLDPKFPIGFFKNKRALDIGCGAGRWTKTFASLGAAVKSLDVSEHALRSVRRFTRDAEILDIFGIEKRADLKAAFDFALCWGVLIHTHDPKIAFRNAAHPVKRGGSLYFAVYAPTYHASELVRNSRLHYHRNLRTFEDRLAFAYELTNGNRANAISEFDMLNTFYNWTIEPDTIRGWCLENGLSDPVFLNRDDPNLCHHHVLTTRIAD